MLNLIGYDNEGYKVKKQGHTAVIAKGKNDYVVWYYKVKNNKPSFFWGEYSTDIKMINKIFNKIEGVC
jgi:hypothetical protein